MRTRFGLATVLAVVVMALGAGTAQAFYRTSVTGVPGAFGSAGYVPNIEAGVCNDTGVYAQVGYTCSTTYGTNYFDPSCAYLSYWNGSGWVAYREANLGNCTNRAGSGVGRCLFRHPAEDQVSNNCTGGACRPVFANVPPGTSYNVYIRVIWRNASTGAILGTANYLPVDTSSPTGAAGGPDIGCQVSYAYKIVHRCITKDYQGTWYFSLT